MDFLKIRSKAKERSASHEAAVPGQAAADRAAPAPARPPEPAPAAPPAPAGQAEQESRWQGDDARFTTWKPGSGERPTIAPPGPPDLPRPDASAFAVYDPVRSSPGQDLGAFRTLTPAPRVPPPAAVPGPVGSAAPQRPPVAADPLEDFFYRPDEEVAALAGLPVEPAVAATAGHEETVVEEYLTFRLGAEEYAVAIEYVHEVLKAPPITEVPRAPAGILGVVNVRGEVVAVIDPRQRLSLPATGPAAEAGRIVIVDDGEGACGLLVDGVASVVRLPRGSVEPCPQGIGGASAECLAGIGRERSRIFTVLDLPTLLRRGPASERAGRREHAGA